MTQVHRGRIALVIVDDGLETDECVVLTGAGIWEIDNIEATAHEAVKAGGGVTSSVEVTRPTRPSVRGLETLDVAVAVAGWAATSAAWDVAKLLATRLAHGLLGRAARDKAMPSSPLTDSEAVTRARWLIAERYAEDMALLRPVEVDLTELEAKVVLSGLDREYSVWLVVRDELVLAARIRRVAR